MIGMVIHDRCDWINISDPDRLTCLQFKFFVSVVSVVVNMTDIDDFKKVQFLEKIASILFSNNKE
ncbi:hypothetical protein SBFV2_gp04 [Sulfolobales Beppu filamentous virus 2]|uniref:Uncharacterized protein n=1 Tax=Sulfolobales Beppu filamentous virus 2 TaxID=2493123 RepID=A0A3Q8Q3P9_9VIRU|nr:hypothetical protein HOU84_gp04 [Sulfolobales Beppu filamentous virus 2]AZI75771.1 hypothetical protein SBFV2_gp04 [Sulfolobales Beppu filamentous virus 2]